VQSSSQATAANESLSLAERLTRKRQETEMKIRQQKEQRDRNEMVGCTFHPQLMNNHYYQTAQA
jgi:hypothetical protein